MFEHDFPEGNLDGWFRAQHRATGRRPPGPSEAEDALALALSRWSPFYWRQEQRLGDYRADFFCPSAQLVVEVDGSSHDGREAHDHRRDAAMAARGVETLRFPVKDVERNAYAVVVHVNRRCVERCEVEEERSLDDDAPLAAFRGGPHFPRIPNVRKTDAPSDLRKPPSKSEFRCRLCQRTLSLSQRDFFQGYCHDCVRSTP